MAGPESMPDTATLARYLAGEGSASDRVVVETWASAHPDHQHQLAALASAWEAAAASPPRADVEVSLAQVLARTGQVAQSTPHLVHDLSGVVHYRSSVWRASRHSMWERIGLVARAVLVVGLGVGLAFRSSAHPYRLAARNYVTARGQRLTVTLSDGTQFTLAPASQLTVAPGYEHGVRDVRLDGEAYFTVIHDAAHPFAVHVRNIVARDIGTAFDVRHYASDSAVRVAVTEGQVNVETQSAGAGVLVQALRRSDLATITQTGIAVTHQADVAALTAWRDRRLVFQRTRFADAAEEIGRWYDLDIRVPDAGLRSQEVTAAFSDDSLPKILTILGMSLDAQVTRIGHVVVFTPKEKK